MHTAVNQLVLLRHLLFTHDLETITQENDDAV